jgi:choline dehydrogenase-like flavoprotein
MYDVIVVGARCAGATTAMLLARKGHRVLLVDRSTFPSDLRLSTHQVWQPGVAALKRWGLLDEVTASGCPAMTTAALDVGPFTVTGTMPPAHGVREAYAPRRVVLDAILVNAAVQAGAELWEGCTVDGLLTGDRPRGRATGPRHPRSPPQWADSPRDGDDRGRRRRYALPHCRPRRRVHVPAAPGTAGHVLHVLERPPEPRQHALPPPVPLGGHDSDQ